MYLGADGNDIFGGGTSHDRIFGGSDSDTVYGASGGHDVLDGGANEPGLGDTLTYTEFAGPVTVTLLSPRSGAVPPVFRATGIDPSWTDTFLNFENLILTANTDVLLLDQPTVDALSGEGMEVDAAANFNPMPLEIEAYAGLPVHALDDAGDTVSLENYAVLAGDTVRVDLDLADPENLPYNGLMTHNGRSVALLNFESVLGSAAKDQLLGSANGNYLFGFAGDDILVGRGAADGLVGDAGADTLYGGTWTGLDLDENGAPLGTAPTEYQNDGASDYLYGGAGNDTYYVSAFDSIWDSTLNATELLAATPANERFYASGDGAVYFNGKLLTGGEKVATSYWNDYPPSPNLGINLPTQIALFVDHAMGMVYRVMNAYTVASNGTRVDHYVIIAEDRNTKEAISIAGVNYDPATGTLTGSGFLGMTIVAAPVAQDTSGNDTLRGGNGNDTLIASAGNDTLKGSGGTDQLYGGVGTDTLDGGAGNDRLEGGAGADSLTGGSGIDTADYLRSNAAVEVHLGGASFGGHAAGDSLTGIENISGSGLADKLYGNSGNNILVGRGGADFFEGGGGIDVFDGGTGNDGVSFAAIANAAIAVNLATGVFGGAAAGNTYVSVESFMGTNFYPSGSESDPINSDRFTGNDVRDDFYGLRGRDSLDGAGGDDLLNGGSGNDLLTGGSGNDIFHYSTYFDDGDTITDFTQGQDLIIFEIIDGYFLYTEGNDLLKEGSFTGAFTFIGTNSFSGVAGQLRYEHIAGNTIVSIDLNTNLRSDFKITLAGTIDLLATDFRQGPTGGTSFASTNVSSSAVETSVSENMIAAFDASLRSDAFVFETFAAQTASASWNGSDGNSGAMELASFIEDTSLTFG